MGVLVLSLAVLAGWIVWLFRDEPLHPFGDVRACEGSSLRLPDPINVRGTSIPTDASDIHYVTRNDGAAVTFVSNQTTDYLHRAHVLPEGEPLFDEQYGTKGIADDEISLPDGLCGSSLRGPVWIYDSTGTPGAEISVMVERSPTSYEDLRVPARAVVTYRFP
ncbi:hypothetical protein ACWEWP_33155 [Streptomyces olivaceus]